MAVNFDFNFWTVMLFAMNFALAILVAVSNSRKAKDNELKELQVRVATLEVKHDNGINKADIIALHRRLDELLSAVRHMEGRYEGERRSEGGRPV
jgi:hypothetical protein